MVSRANLQASQGQLDQRVTGHHPTIPGLLSSPIIHCRALGYLGSVFAVAVMQTGGLHGYAFSQARGDLRVGKALERHVYEL
jgi:hypothetical protein